MTWHSFTRRVSWLSSSSSQGGPRCLLLGLHCSSLHRVILRISSVSLFILLDAAAVRGSSPVCLSRRILAGLLRGGGGYYHPLEILPPCYFLSLFPLYLFFLLNLPLVYLFFFFSFIFSSLVYCVIPSFPFFLFSFFLILLSLYISLLYFQLAR